MKTIIAGSRSITDRDFIYGCIARSGFTISEVVCGGANGVDSVGKLWAIQNNIPVVTFPANWEEFGHAAGPIRNKQMAEYADALILIWDGKSRGSKSMHELAIKNNLKIREYRLDNSTNDVKMLF